MLGLASCLALSTTVKAERDDLPPPGTPTVVTNAPNAFDKTNLVPVISAVTDWFKLVKPYLSNNIAIFEGGPLYSTHTKSFGGWGAVKVPVNDLVTLGFEAQDINHHIYYGPFTAQLGREFTGIPVIKSVYAYVESGPTLQFGHGSTLGAQSFAGFQKKWKLSDRWEVMLGGGTGNITSELGMICAGQLALSWKWSKPAPAK